MMPLRFEVEIGEVVLQGVPREEVAGLPEAIEHDLVALASGHELSRTTVGAQVARAVWAKLPRRRSQS